MYLSAYNYSLEVFVQDYNMRKQYALSQKRCMGVGGDSYRVSAICGKGSNILTRNPRFTCWFVYWNWDIKNNFMIVFLLYVRVFYFMIMFLLYSRVFFTLQSCFLLQSRVFYFMVTFLLFIFFCPESPKQTKNGIKDHKHADSSYKWGFCQKAGFCVKAGISRQTTNCNFVKGFMALVCLNSPLALDSPWGPPPEPPGSPRAIKSTRTVKCKLGP